MDLVMLRPSMNQRSQPVTFSSHGAALRDPAAHKFVPGRGYFAAGRLASLPAHTAPADRCNPPAGTQDRTWHALQPPQGAAPINFRWHADARTWFRRDGRAHRLGFTAEYLSRVGWIYLRSVNGSHSIQ